VGCQTPSFVEKTHSRRKVALSKRKEGGALYQKKAKKAGNVPGSPLLTLAPKGKE